jgi:hypothetical protein
MHRCNAEKQISGKPVEPPQQQDKELAFLGEFNDLLKAWSVFRSLGARYAWVGDDFHELVRLRFGEAPDRSLLHL